MTFFQKQKKLILFLSSITRPSFIIWLPLLFEILGNIRIVIVCLPGCDVIFFKINIIFLIKPFSLHHQKVKTKSWISWERKELLRWNGKKHFIIFKRLVLKKIKQCFWEGENPTKLYFMYYLREVIILLRTGLYKSVFSTYSIGKSWFSTFCILVFRVSVSLAFNFEFC